MTTIPTDLDKLLNGDAIMENPYPIYKRLRDEAPVAWSELWQAWVISRYDDVEVSLKDKVNLSNENRQALLFSELKEEEKKKLCPLRHYFAQKDVIGSDPPDHTRMRSLVQKAFTPKMIKGLEPRIRDLCEDLIGQAIRKPSFDFIEELAHPMPVILIAEMLGAPVEDRPKFKTWSTDILAFQGTGKTTFDLASISQKSLIELFEYMSVLIDDRKENPKDDIITALAMAEVDGKGFTRDELLATCNTILTAGHETTTNLVGNMIHLLMKNPEQWELLKSDPDTYIPKATEEALRFESPKQRNFRRVKVAHEFGGETFEENQMVFQLIGAAHHDERKYENPDQFDISRGSARHLAFGAGIHICLGASLARMEAKVVLETLLEMAPDIELDESMPFSWQERVQFRGPGELQLVH